MAAYLDDKRRNSHCLKRRRQLLPVANKFELEFNCGEGVSKARLCNNGPTDLRFHDSFGKSILCGLIGLLHTSVSLAHRLSKLACQAVFCPLVERDALLKKLPSYVNSYVWQVVYSITCVARQQRVYRISENTSENNNRMPINCWVGHTLLPQFTVKRHVPVFVCYLVGSLES